MHRTYVQNNTELVLFFNTDGQGKLFFPKEVFRVYLKVNTLVYKYSRSLKPKVRTENKLSSPLPYII